MDTEKWQFGAKWVFVSKFYVFQRCNIRQTGDLVDFELRDLQAIFSVTYLCMSMYTQPIV